MQKRPECAPEVATNGSANNRRSTNHTAESTKSQVAGVIKALFESRDLVEIRCLPTKGEQGLPRQKWLRAEQLRAAVDELRSANTSGANIFFGVNPRRRHGGSANDVSLARCLFVDFDGVTLDHSLRLIDDANLPIPTLIVASGHGAHAYWRLEQPITELTIWSAWQKSLIELVNSDRNVFDPPRIMRLPGFRNHKPPPADADLFDVDARRIYPLQEFPDGAAIAAASRLSERSERSQTPLRTSQNSLIRKPDVQRAIALTPPNDPNQRRKKLFQLARILKNIPELQNVDPTSLEPIVREWHRKAKGVINHKEFETSFADFCDGWRRVKYPAESGPVAEIFDRAKSQDPPSVAAQFPTPCAKLLCAFCRQLQRKAGNEPFRLDERTAAMLLGVSQPAVNFWFRELRRRGILDRVESPARGRASRFRYLGSLKD